MAEVITVEMAAPPPSRPPFYRTRKGLFILLCILFVICAGIFSWWLAQGKVTSVAAELDTVIYTVEPQVASRLDRIYVQPGDLVQPGQALARTDAQISDAYMNQAGADIASLRQLPGMAEISERLGSAQQAEKNMAARIAQARKHEDELRAVWQERVTEHVRAQLAMRSINPGNRAAYQQAQQAETAARSRMEAAKEEFEQGSRMRAAMDAELNRIRAEILRAKRRGEVPTYVNNGGGAAAIADNDLYSPVPGKILRINGSQGQIAQPGQPLFLILPTGANFVNDIWIQAWFPLEAKNKIKNGQKVIIKFSANGEHVNGTVTAISDEAQILPVNDSNATNMNSVERDKQKYNAIRYLPVRISLDDPSQVASLQPGAKAECQIQSRYIWDDFF